MTETASLPPTARQVLDGLRRLGPTTNQELVETTQLGRRTIYRALRTLIEEGLVRRRPNLRDTRKWIYVLEQDAMRQRRG